MQRGAEGRAVRVRASEFGRRLWHAPVVGGVLERLTAQRAMGRVRADPGRRGAVAMAVVAMLTIAVVGFWVLSQRPRQLAASSSPVPSAVASVSAGGSLMSPLPTATPAASGSSTGVVVDVAGKVHRPGVYRLALGSRVDDAVTAAGGLLPGVDPVSVNLARKLLDGEQVVIGVAAVPAAGGGAEVGGGESGAASNGGAGSLVDLNSATETQLDALPGVGPVLAQHILDWRTQHGRFDSVDQLNAVSGIGDAKFADLKPLVTVS